MPTKLIVDFDCIAISGELITSGETSDVKWIDIPSFNNYVESHSLRRRFGFLLKVIIAYNILTMKPGLNLKLERNI